MKEQIQQLINSGDFVNFQLAYAIDKFTTMGIVNDMLIPEINKIRKSNFSPVFFHTNLFMLHRSNDIIQLWVHGFVIGVAHTKEMKSKSIAAELCRKLSKQF